MSSPQNLEIIRRCWDAWKRGDLDALFAVFSPDVIWEMRLNWPEGEYRGKEAIRRFLDDWLEVWGDYEIDIEDVRTAPDGRVITLLTHRGRGGHSGAPLELEMAQIATLREGKIVRLENFDDRDEALRAAGLSK